MTLLPLLRMMGALALVLGGLAGALWAVRRAMRPLRAIEDTAAAIAVRSSMASLPGVTSPKPSAIRRVAPAAPEQKMPDSLPCALVAATIPATAAVTAGSSLSGLVG